MHSDDPVTLGTVTADSNGKVTFTFTIPASASLGEHTITLTGETSGSVEGEFRVLADPVNPNTPTTPTGPINGGGAGDPRVDTGGTLAQTGDSNLSGVLTAALVLLVTGFGIIRGTRRRRAGRVS